MNLKEESRWVENIYQIERTDPILGGEFGINNVQAKQLAARTQYLLWFLTSFHAADGHHVLKGRDIAAGSVIPENRFAFGDSTASVHEDIESLRTRYNNILRAMNELSSDSSAPATALYQAMLLAWKYGDDGLDFCLFTPEFTFLPKEDLYGKYRVYLTVDGDDSIDVTASESLVPGEDYVMSFPDNSNLPRLVTISNILELDRVLLTEDLDVTTNNAVLSKTTWVVDNGTAIAGAGGMLLTRNITALSDFPYGVLDIAFSSDTENASFNVQYRKIVNGVAQEWLDAEYLGKQELSGLTVASWRYEAGSTVQFKIVADSPCIVDFMAVYPPVDAREPEFVRTPYIVGPLQLERYGALYQDPFDKLEITISDVPDISVGTTVYLTAEKLAAAYVDTESPVIDVTAAVGAELNAASPPFLLIEGATYYWRARYHAQSGMKSMWTNIEHFNYAPLS